MDDALVIGGTRFIGRHLVEDLLAEGYDVTTLNRGTHPDPFADREGVDRIEGDRTDDDAIYGAADRVDPDAVFDMVAYHPPEVRAAVDAFADVDAYVYVSSGSAYADAPVPWRESEAPLHDCTDGQETDDSPETYGPRKAECDRVCFEAAEEGIAAKVVRPMLVYGPHDYTERLDYWIDRVHEYDRVLVPGDGASLLHRSYVEDVASGLRVVAEEGDPGEAYNAADRHLVTLRGSLERIADALDTEVDVVTASERELAEFDLDPSEFPLHVPDPALVGTRKLADLGWESTPLETAYERTVEDHLDSDRTGRENGPDREAEAAAIAALTDGG